MPRDCQPIRKVALKFLAQRQDARGMLSWETYLSYTRSALAYKSTVVIPLLEKQSLPRTLLRM